MIDLNEILKPANHKAQLRISVLIFLILCASLSYLVIKAVSDPSIPFLKADPQAKWIRYPLPGQTSGRFEEFASFTTTFRKNFDVEEIPSTARLYVKAFRKCRIWVNNEQIYSDPHNENNWKKLRQIDIVPFLKSGANHIAVEVSCHHGPPSLLLYTQGLHNDLSTDNTWTTSMTSRATIPARIADDTRMLSINFKNISPLDALRKKLPILTIFFVVSAALYWLNFYAQKKTKFYSYPFQAFISKMPQSVLTLCIIFWVLLFINNYPRIPPTYGFDTWSHISYVEYLINSCSIPLANQGWEMYQPPLFYLASAILLVVTRLSITEPYALYILKLIPLLCGVGQICLVYFAARILFPNSKVKQAISVAMIALIPMNIYISHYVSNESLCAFLMALSILITIKILCKSHSSVSLFCVLGIVLGLALLTKPTALVIFPVIYLLLLYKLTSEAKCHLSRIVKYLGVMTIWILIIAGWFYLRNWSHFGKPLISNWEPLTGFYWWMDPGFHTHKYFFRFGGVFKFPYFSGYYSFFDSMYSTLWGDGFYGGKDLYWLRPPWNYEYMSALYLISIPASLSFLFGLYQVVKHAITYISKSWLLILGSVFTIGFSMIYMNLKLPHYTMAKAFYGLAIVMPLALIGGWGIAATDKWLQTKNCLFLRSILYAWLGTLAATVFLAFFVTTQRPEVPLEYGMYLTQQGKYGLATKYYNEALQISPNFADAHNKLGYVLARQGKLDEAIEHLTKALRIEPDSADSHSKLGLVFFRQGKLDRAVTHFNEALRIKPDLADAHSNLGYVLMHQDKLDQAIEHLTEALRIKPDLANAHHNLGCALARRGKLDEAIGCFNRALVIKPDFADAHNDLGVVLALRGKLDEAIMHFIEALRINPDFADAQNNLDVIIAKQDKLNKTYQFYNGPSPETPPE